MGRRRWSLPRSSIGELFARWRVCFGLVGRWPICKLPKSCGEGTLNIAEARIRVRDRIPREGEHGQSRHGQDSFECDGRCAQSTRTGNRRKCHLAIPTAMPFAT